MWTDCNFPITTQMCQGVAEQFGTPVWLYDRATIEARITELQSFDVVRYAQKANSNLGLLSLMRKHGVVVDAVSAGEIVRALRVGFSPREKVSGIVFTADLFDRDALDLVRIHRIPVNIGSPDMIAQLAEAGIQVPLTVRVNPGFGHGHSRKTNTGGTLSKHGVWHKQLKDTIKVGKEKGLPISGLHMHIGSGSDFHHLSQVCGAMVEAAKLVGSDLHSISAGGGLPIPYRKDQLERIDVAAYFKLWDEARKQIEAEVGHPVALEVEPGRYLVAESGYLIAQLRSIKKVGNRLFYLIDAGFNDLVRPAFYGSWHHISVIPADGRDLGSARVNAIVAGPLCESGDVFTQEEGGFVVHRELPVAKVGDYVVLHDAGAYGAAMSSNYNSRRLAPEVLWSNGKPLLIRERQSFDHLLALDKIPVELSEAMIRLLTMLILMSLPVFAGGDFFSKSNRDWNLFAGASLGWTQYQAKDLNDVMSAMERQSAEAAGLNHYAVGIFNGHPRQAAMLGAYWRNWMLGVELEFWVESFNQNTVPFYLNRDLDSRFAPGQRIECSDLRVPGFTPVDGGTAGCIQAEEVFTLIPVTLQGARLFPFWNRHLWLGVGGGGGILAGSARLKVSTDFIGAGSRPDDTVDLELYPGINPVFKSFAEVSLRPWSWLGLSLKGGYRWSSMKYVELSKKSGDSFLFGLILNQDSELHQGDRAYLLRSESGNDMLMLRGAPTDAERRQAELAGNHYDLVSGDFSGWMLETKLELIW